MKNTLLLFIVLLAASYISYGQTRKYSNEFLSIGVGGRALSMSGSVIATNKDIYSAYWNPAGLSALTYDRNIALMHSEYFAGIAKYDFGSFVFKLENNSAFAISVIRFGVDDIPNTSELIDSEGNIDYDKVTSFSAIDFAALLSYARALKLEGLSVGGSVKIIRRKAGDFARSWGFGFDLAMQYNRANWKFGGVLRDASSTFNAWSYSLSDQMKEVYTLTGNEIPVNSLEITMPKLLLGVAYNFKIGSNFELTPELDFDISSDKKRNVLVKSNVLSVDPHMGLEFDYKKIVFLRAGVGNIQNYTDDFGNKITTFQPNIGLGLNIKNFLSIDYAFTDIGNQSIALYSNVFSLSYSFNRKRD